MKIRLLFYFSLSVLFFACDSPSSEQDNTAADAVDLKAFEDLGTEITAASFSTLSGQVKAALQEGGVPNAVGYCKISAYGIIDSLSKVHNAKITRTSLKPRNGKNTATPEQSSILKQFEADRELGKQVMPFAQDMGDRGVNFYAPILTQKACLQCHGVLGETLTEENDKIIKGLYPTDKATGYKEDDLRGMWVVNFKKDQ
jgi:hypothetical protein